MKAKVIWETHDEEAIEKAQRLGMPEPKPERSEGEIHWKKEAIELAYINEVGKIVLYLHNSGPWIVDFNESMWSEIVRFLNQ